MPSADAYRWQSTYARCFDRRGNLLAPEMRQFVSQLEQEKTLTNTTRTTADASYLLALLAHAYTHLGDWQKAEEANLQLVSATSTHEQAEITYSNLAGIYAMQRQWGRSLYYYGRRVGHNLLHRVIPRLLLCLCWVVLWRIGKKKPFPPGALWYLMLFVSLVGIFSLTWDVGIPMHSFLFTGNPGTVLVSYRTYKIVEEVVSIEWTLFSLLLAFWMRKRIQATTESHSTEQTTSEWSASAREIHPAKRWFVQTGRTLVIVGIGLWLGNTGSRPYLDVLPNWNTYIHTIRHEEVVDLLWIVGLFSTSVLSPIAQEFLFRGTIYRYARQVGDIGFGLALSSVVFAAIHLQATPDQMLGLVVVGVILACQYEFTGRLGPPIVTHCIANFLAAIGQAGSPR